MSSALPSFRFRLFGFPVAVGVDFLLITLILGLQARPGVYLLEWLAVVAVSILIHELGHAFAVRSYGINPEIRLWGMGGLTLFAYALPPRKSILVSLAGPLVGIPVAVVVMVIKPWLPASEPLAYITTDLIFINLWWGVLNLLPLAGLDGGNVTTNAFLIAMGERGRRPGLAFVGLASIVVAVVAAVGGFIFLTIVIAFFALMNPEPYQVLWRMVGGGGSPGQSRVGSPGRPNRAAASNPSGGSLFARAAASANEPRKRDKSRVPVTDAATARRAFGELYLEAGPGGESLDASLEELEVRPAPLLPDVMGMVARKDDAAIVARLADEPDPLAILGIVMRVVEARRVPELLAAIRRTDATARERTAFPLQAALHALGRFDESMAAAELVGAGNSRCAVLEARSAARTGNGKRAEAALRRALALGSVRLSDSDLGDIARLGADQKIADVLAAIRASAR